jgi:hypothetical protein
VEGADDSTHREPRSPRLATTSRHPPPRRRMYAILRLFRRTCAAGVAWMRDADGTGHRARATSTPGSRPGSTSALPLSRRSTNESDGDGNARACSVGDHSAGRGDFLRYVPVEREIRPTSTCSVATVSCRQLRWRTAATAPAALEGVHWSVRRRLVEREALGLFS